MSATRVLKSKPETFLLHKFTTPEVAWLRLAAKTPGFDPRVARVRLRKSLPPEFTARSLDSRFYRDGRLTLLGIRYFDPKHKPLITLKRVIEAVRARILEEPGIVNVTAAEIMEATGLPERDVCLALGHLQEFNGFSTGGMQKQSGEFSSISLNGDDAYNEYLSFSTLDSLFERQYRERDPAKTFPQVRSPLESHDTSAASWPSEPPIKRNTAFVIMAIDPQRPELIDVLQAIKDACSEYGITAYRADEIEHQDRITDRILDEIRTCEHLIADLSYERPNVYYEVGFAHALAKKPILYRRQGTKLHFDLSVHNVPEYRNATELKDQLRQRLEAIVGHAPKAKKANRVASAKAESKAKS